TGMGRHADRRATKQVVDDGDVVGSQVPHRVGLQLEDAEVRSHRIDVEDVAEVTVVDEPLQLAHGGGVEVCVAGHELYAAAVRQRRELQGRLHAGCKRLLDQAVDA